MKFPEIELPSMFEVSKIITLFKICMNKHNGNLPKDQVYPFWLMYFVSEGFFYYKKNGVLYTAKSGDIFFKSPNEYHEPTGLQSACIMHQLAFVPEKENLDFLKNKIFSSEKANELANMLFSKGTKYFYWNDDICSPSGMSVFSDTTQNDLYNLKLTLQSLLNVLFEDYRLNGSVSIKKQTLETDLFSEAVNYMKSNIDKNITISDIAAALGVSHSTIKAVFAKKLDCGIMNYFYKLRVKHAKEMLARGQSVTEVAEALGFSSTSYFSRFFKKQTGLSPINFKE